MKQEAEFDLKVVCLSPNPCIFLNKNSLSKAHLSNTKFMPTQNANLEEVEVEEDTGSLELRCSELSDSVPTSALLPSLALIPLTAIKLFKEGSLKFPHSFIFIGQNMSF